MAYTDRLSLGRPTTRPDLTHLTLDLPPGQWWSPDGHLHIEVYSVGEEATPHSGRGLPEGWVWLLGDLLVDGRMVDVCTMPVRLDARPPEEVSGA
jgi:hypothetical protein